MTFTSIQLRFRKSALLLLVLALPLASSGQSCPPPINPQAGFDPYVPDLVVMWTEPTSGCPVDYYEVEYAFSSFTPGTGVGTLLTTEIPFVGFLFSPPPPTYAFVAYVRSVCNPPPDCGNDPDENFSEWVLATYSISPAPEPPGAGSCDDAQSPYPSEDGCLDGPIFSFWEEYEQDFLTINPCTDEAEYMIWQEYTAPGTGELGITAVVLDIGAPGAPAYDDFGMVIYSQNCNGELVVCDSSMTENDTLNISVPAGETFILGAWFNNAEYNNNPVPGFIDGLALDLSLCEYEPECPYPTGISISAITDQSALIEWDNTEELTWILEYGLQGFAPGSGSEIFINSESPFLLEGLQPATQYEFYLRTLCVDHGNSSNSANIGPFSLETFSSLTIEETIPNGQAYCCDNIALPETVEVTAFCDSVYFTHSDYVLGSSCPYTIQRIITVHDTCGNSLSTSFSYDFLGNDMPCGCEGEQKFQQGSAADAVAMHGEWAIADGPGFLQIFKLQDGEWILYDNSIPSQQTWKNSLDLYGDVFINREKIYRLTDDEWVLETVLPDTLSSGITPYNVAIHGNTIALDLDGEIIIREHIDGVWVEVASFPHESESLDLDEDMLISGVELSGFVGRIYRKNNGTWVLEQLLPDFIPNNGLSGPGYEVAIEGSFAAVGYRSFGGVYTYEFDGSTWQSDTLLSNPYKAAPGPVYTSAFGNAIDIEGDIMVIGDHMNQMNGLFSGSIVVYERACGNWQPQRNIVPSNGSTNQRFGGTIDLYGTKLVSGIDDTYYSGIGDYNGPGDSWFYSCLENTASYSIDVNPDITVPCIAAIPPTEDAYTLGNAWCTPVSVEIETDTIGSGCDLVITRTFTASDGFGNTASATQEITLLDEQAPTVSPIQETVALVCLEGVSLPEPVFTDNCSNDIEVIFESDTVVENCTTIIEQSWTATDECGNTTVQERTITVTDTPPQVAFAPEDLNISCTEIAEFAEPVFIDNCNSPVEIAFEADTLSDGCSTAIDHEWTATDLCGNSTMVTRSITISDDTPPELSCPSDFSISLPSGEDSYTLVNLLDSVAVTDNCSAVEINQSTPPGTPLEPGTHIISISASDGCNTAECAVEITVTIDTGVEDEDEPDVTLFPNPTSGKVTLELPNSRFSRVELFDMTGKSLLHGAFNSRIVELDLKHLPTGIYAVQVITDEYRVVRKVVLE